MFQDNGPNNAAVYVGSSEEPTLKPGLVRDHRIHSQVGNYILHERLGRGGMAAVYRATHKGFGTQVAIKMLDPRHCQQPGMLGRFLREARVMREISESNRYVVRAIDFGETATGEAYLVMEYLNGQDLHQVLKTVGPLSWSRLAPIALQLCEALTATHARNLVHRDIKPSNCFLTAEGAEQVVKLIDYGIAKDLNADAEYTTEGVILGTPAYLAPEIVLGDATPNKRTDIYALGATLYCLLTGKPPFEGRQPDLVAHQLRTQTLPPPSARRSPDLPPIPSIVDEILMRALHSDAACRFQRIEDLADEIRLSMEPATSTSKLRAPIDRHRLNRRGLSARVAGFSGLVVGFAALLSLDPPPVRGQPWRPGGAPLAALRPRIEAVDGAEAEADVGPGQAVDDRPDQPVDPEDDGGRARGPVADITADDPGRAEKPAASSVQASGQSAREKSGGGSANSDIRPQKVRRVLDGRVAELRDECALLGGRSLRFTVTVQPDGVLEAVSAHPGPFRECVRAVLRGVDFGVNGGRYSYSFRVK